MILSPEFFGGFLDDIYKINNKFIINAKLIDFLNSVLKEDNTSTFQFENERVNLKSYPHE